jgi:mannose-1-phosphate guanylyltransferase
MEQRRMESDRLEMNDPLGSFWAIVPAGGSGTRLWPLSRAARPKFLLPLLGSTSLLQDTVSRLAPLTRADQTFIVCGPAHAASIARQLPELPDANIVVEPSPKGSGPAIGLATALIARRDPAAIVGSFAADHQVTNQQAFLNAVNTARETAQQDWLVTIGLTPTRPETGFGYIERTDDVVQAGACGAAYRAARFVEKPNLETAKAYLETGRFAWNASMFIWKASTFLEEMRRLQPELAAGIDVIVDAWDTPEQERVTAEVWAGLQDSTIDQGIMELASRVAVVPADLGWSDVGDWHGLGELLTRDDRGNGVSGGNGSVITVDASQSVVWTESDRIVALVGVENAVVVDLPDALLVASRDRAQDVRKIVDVLKKQHASRCV